jgi:lipopolysaccharide/colanic/teichoic acid biosynthesis glycosyltransferase
MLSGARYAPILLFFGDLAVFVLSLWISVFVRGGEPLTGPMLFGYVTSFSLLFCVWLLVFYIAGLYEKRAILFKRELPEALLRTQVFNIILAALFFFLIPSVGIAPKTTLVIYLVVSLALIYLWRLGIFPKLTQPLARAQAVIIGAGPEVEELAKEVNGNSRYRMEFSVVYDPRNIAPGGFVKIAEELQEKHISIIVVDTENDAVKTMLPFIYNLSFVQKKYQFADLYELYEEVFDRVPLSLLHYEWFLKNISYPAAGIYSIARRLFDIVGGLVMGLITLIAIPFVWIAMRFEGPGPLFISQERIGRYGAYVRAYKFRSMSFNDKASGSWVGEGENRVTKLGAILRLSSLDEFPQFLNILKGELSLIGPRNDIEGLGKRLAEAIPYYNVRYIVKPGITGWAQINQQYEQGQISPQSIEETKMRLAYDFYYIKNRSFMLDVVIALKTIKRMLFRLSSW